MGRAISHLRFILFITLAALSIEISVEAAEKERRAYLSAALLISKENSYAMSKKTRTGLLR